MLLPEQTDVSRTTHNGAMKRLTKGTLIAATGLVAVAVLVWATGRGSAVEVTPVVQGPLLQSVVMSGRVSTTARIDLSAQTTGRIEAVLVREGDSVKAGQIVIRLRADEAQATLEQTAAAVTQARARLQEIKTIQVPVTAQQLEQARALDQQIQAELRRTKDLVSQGFVSQSRLDDSQRQASASAAALRAAQAQAQGNSAQGATTLLAQAALEQALASQRAAAVRLDQLGLRAHSAGIVIARSAEPGDTAQPGKTLLTIASGDTMRIEASVDEKNLKLLALGQSAIAMTDAFPERKFQARVDYLAPSVDAQRGTIALRLAVEPQQSFLRPDMTVSVEIVTGRRESTLTLPSDAIRQDSDGKPYVLVNRDGTARKVTVSTGLVGTGTIEVTAGLAAGDRVILPGGLVADGDRVRETSVRPPKGNAPQIPGMTG